MQGAASPPETEAKLGPAPDTGQADWRPLLEPLERDWQSARFGRIIVRRSSHSSCPDKSASLQLPDPTLEAFPCSGAASSTERALPLCRLNLKRSSSGRPLGIVLEDVSTRWPPLRLAGLKSRRTRVIWQTQEGKEADAWDCNLVDAARKGAAWVMKRGLSVSIDACLDCLAHGAGMTESKLTVGLCVTSMNRLWQLRRALPLNLLQHWRHRKWTRFHVLDFGSTDGTLDFLLHRCRAAIDCGLLHVYHAQERYWHASVAKNTAHLCAAEEILVNVDGDNLIGPDFSQNVVQMFSEGYTVVQYEYGEGTCGRIACWQKDFLQLRGYDEDAFPMGAQDIDLMNRLKSLPGAKFKKVRVKSFCQAIHNDTELKVCLCDPKYPVVSKWGRMNQLNLEMFLHRLNAGQWMRNLHKANIGVTAEKRSREFLAC